ncbi:molybdopterin-guanine dinucleotide biosynthesis protein B [Chitiniphilus eburneus]|uniref:Molybdopterin-guanine dinucleotide biosynthesis protein B n=1 Tax=Chitiniphilus eburneus TaxID=2571148 RepID=A0A4U0PEW7_9NEIS|nr:molybdopterin-guanine dinucleotide biosynthesis protein B [Chitiniphilus eburneus]TJZ66381.1 molybdopterin-guanine dinucleotide biosynthesis protein B [Chitiniphilus eburneus]
MTSPSFPLPAHVLGIVGRSGSGKTTLIEAMLPLFAANGLRVNVIKHSHHKLTLEPPGKDSARFRAAGAQEVLVASPHGFALYRDLHDQPEPDLAAQLARLAPADLVLVEGFKHDPIARLEVHRPTAGMAPLYPELTGLLAVVSDQPVACGLPLLDLNQPAAVAAFILDWLRHDAQP